MSEKENETIDELLIRINDLAHKKKNEGLNEEEIQLQKELRAKYIQLFREGFKQQLDNVKVVDENGNEIKMKKKAKPIH